MHRLTAIDTPMVRYTRTIFRHMQNRATLIARFFLFLTHKALTQVLGLNSKRYVLHRTQSKHASAYI